MVLDFVGAAVTNFLEKVTRVGKYAKLKNGCVTTKGFLAPPMNPEGLFNSGLENLPYFRPILRVHLTFQEGAFLKFYH